MRYDAWTLEDELHSEGCCCSECRLEDQAHLRNELANYADYIARFAADGGEDWGRWTVAWREARQ